MTTATRLPDTSYSYDYLRSQCKQEHAATDAARPVLAWARMEQTDGHYLTTLTLHHTPDHPEGHEHTYTWFDQGAGDFDPHPTSGATVKQALYRIRQIGHGKAHVSVTVRE